MTARDRLTALDSNEIILGRPFKSSEMMVISR